MVMVKESGESEDPEERIKVRLNMKHYLEELCSLKLGS